MRTARPRRARRRRTPAQRRRAAARARRWRIALVTVLCTVGVAAVASVAVLVGIAVQAFNDVGDGIGEIGTAIREPIAPEPIDPVSRYSEAQLANAATIMAAGRDLGLPLRDQAIAVMTAMAWSRSGSPRSRPAAMIVAALASCASL